MIQKLSQEFRAQVALISANCFVDDEYFDYFSTDREEKKRKLVECYSYAFDVAMAVGDCFGFFAAGRLVGYTIVLDYSKLKQENHYYEEIFDVSASEFSGGVYKFVDYANSLAGAKYILALCVLPEFQKQGIGFSLIKHIANFYKKGHLISDVDNKYSLSIYKKLGFKIIEASDKIFIIDKKLDVAKSVR